MIHRSFIPASVLLVVAAPLTSVSVSAAPKELRDGKAMRQRTTMPTQKSITRPRREISCAQYGAGFVRGPGSDNCVRFNGGVGMGVGAVP
jgi:hypothetical protein